MDSLNASKFLAGIENEEYFYFVNSYFAVPGEGGIVAGRTFYGERFCSAVEKGNIFAVQFHPENSGEAGIKVLENFLEVVK